MLHLTKVGSQYIDLSKVQHVFKSGIKSPKAIMILSSGLEVRVDWREFEDLIKTKKVNEILDRI